MTRGNPRIHTNLTDAQLIKLTAWCIRNDRSQSYAVSHAVTRFLDTVEPFQGDAPHKVMARTTPENVEALRAHRGDMWRYVNACVERLCCTESA